MRRNLSKKIVIIAGEESGDQHAAKLVNELQQIYPNIKISGLGGYHLQALGMHNVMDLTQLAITGLTGVLTHLNAHPPLDSLAVNKRVRTN